MAGQADSARALVLRKTELRALELAGNETHLDRLRSGKLESMLTSSIHLDVNKSAEAFACYGVGYGREGLRGSSANQELNTKEVRLRCVIRI